MVGSSSCITAGAIARCRPEPASTTTRAWWTQWVARQTRWVGCAYSWRQAWGTAARARGRTRLTRWARLKSGLKRERHPIRLLRLMPQMGRSIVHALCVPTRRLPGTKGTAARTMRRISCARCRNDSSIEVPSNSGWTRRRRDTRAGSENSFQPPRVSRKPLSGPIGTCVKESQIG